MSINRVIISGNLTRSPELKATQGGTSILSFGVAVNERVKNQQSGEWEDRPNFVDCTMFGARAESLSRILAKGMKVAVEGKLRYSSWDAKDGSKRSKLEVIADEVDLMQRKGEQTAPTGAQTAQEPGYAANPTQYQQPQQQAAYGAPSASPYDDGNLPF